MSVSDNLKYAASDSELGAHGEKDMQISVSLNVSWSPEGHCGRGTALPVFMVCFMRVHQDYIYFTEEKTESQISHWSPEGLIVLQAYSPSPVLFAITKNGLQSTTYPFFEFPTFYGLYGH